MKFFEQLEWLEQMHQLIKLRATGTPKAFVQKIGVSERTLYELLNFAKEFGASIEYSCTRCTYFYRYPPGLQLGFSALEANQIKGGIKKKYALQNFCSGLPYISRAFK